MAGRHSSGVPFRIALPTTVGIVGLALIGFGQAVPNRHSIEHDLTHRSTKALRSAGLSNLTVSFSGRDATISGTSQGDEVSKAEDVVGAVKGVRVATADLSTNSAATPAPAPPASSAPPAPSAPAAPSGSATPSTPATPSDSATPSTPAASAAAPAFPVGFTLQNGTITASGTVRSEATRTALMDAVQSVGHGWKVADRLTVNDTLPATAAPQQQRFPAITRLLATAPITGAELVIQYNGTRVILRGKPSTPAAERALLTAAARTVAASSDVMDGLDVPKH